MSISSAWSVIEQKLNDNGASNRLRGPAGPAELASLRNAIPSPLPAAIVESLERHDGSAEKALVDDFMLYGAAAIERIYTKMLRLGWWKLEWMPFAISASGDFYCVDLKTGRAFYHAHDEGAHSSVYDNYEAWLQAVADAIVAGTATVRGGCIEAVSEDDFILELGEPLD